MATAAIGKQSVPPASQFVVCAYNVLELLMGSAELPVDSADSAESPMRSADPNHPNANTRSSDQAATAGTTAHQRTHSAVNSRPAWFEPTAHLCTLLLIACGTRRLR